MTNPNYIPPNQKRYLTLDAPPEGRFCRSVRLPDDPKWVGLFDGLFSSLVDPDQWREFGGLTQEEMAQAWLEIFLDQQDKPECELVPAPYWDDASDNEVDAPAEDQPWYGAVTDWLAPVDELNFEQNIALWALTGFVAYAAGVGSAIFFRTTAKRFIIAIEAGDVPEIIRVVVDSAEFNIDTTGLAGTIIEQDVVGDPALEEHDIYVIKGDFP